MEPDHRRSEEVCTHLSGASIDLFTPRTSRLHSEEAAVTQELKGLGIFFFLSHSVVAPYLCGEVVKVCFNLNVAL